MPYADNLKRFPANLPQLQMESNGKHVALDRQHVSDQTGPIIWGEPGQTANTRFTNSFIKAPSSSRVITSILPAA